MKKTESKIITIKRRISTKNKELIRYLEDNMWYARKVYNDAVAIYLNYFNEECKRLDAHENLKGGFNFMKEATLYHNEIESNDPKYPYYCVGIRANCFNERLPQMHKMVWKMKCGKFKNKKQNIHARPHFKKYNPFEGSFKVENKQSPNSKHKYSMINILNNNKLLFKANRENHFEIILREPLFNFTDGTYFCDDKQRYAFKTKSIKQLGFVKENNKYYIIIVTKVIFLLSDFYLRNPHFKMRKAGIDLGIHNPVSLYNGVNIDQFDVIPKKAQLKINKLIERTKKLKNIMDRKMNTNKNQGNMYSRNYRKVQLKFKKTWEKINNITKWHRWDTAINIAKSYYMLIVDNFTQPDNSGKSNVSDMNRGNREQGMYLFNEILKYVCKKYICIYIPAPDNTTRTCSCCGHINPKLKLSERTLTCKKCGTKIDRDENAAINCYNFNYIIG